MYEARGHPRHFRTKKGMPSLLATLKGCNLLMTLVILSLEIVIGERALAGYVSLGILVRSASGTGKRTGTSGLWLFQRGSWLF